MPRVAYFEIQVEDVDRAGKFYQDVFGWEISKWDGPGDYWIVKTGDNSEKGINGGIMKMRGEAPLMTNSINVPSVDEYTKKATDAGGTIILPKMTIPGVGYVAYVKDTEGIIIGIFQEDKSAK